MRSYTQLVGWLFIPLRYLVTHFIMAHSESSKVISQLPSECCDIIKDLLPTGSEYIMTILNAMNETSMTKYIMVIKNAIEKRHH